MLHGVDVVPKFIIVALYNTWTILTCMMWVASSDLRFDLKDLRLHSRLDLKYLWLAWDLILETCVHLWDGYWPRLTCVPNLKLDIIRWFSHRRSPSPLGGHAVVSFVAACCVRPTAHALLCIVNGDDSASFSFVCPWWSFWSLTLTFELGRNFCTMHLTAKFHHPMLNHSEAIVRTETNWQTDAAENIDLASLRYAGG